jgi:farnesol dehydrogenase
VKRVLVTGGTGYLGGAVVRAFQEGGWRVRSLVRPTSDRCGLPSGVEVVTGDVTDPETLPPALVDVQAVCHSAAVVSSWARDRRLFRLVNVEGLTTVLEAALRSAVPRVVYTSTIFVLGPSEEAPGSWGGVPDETYVPARRRFHTEYERTKTQALTRVGEFAARGLPVVTVIPGVLYGPGRTTEGSFINPLIAAVARGRLGPLVGTGRQRWCFACVADVARGHVLAAERGQPGARYILGGENLAVADFLSLAAELAGRAWHWRALPLRLAQAFTVPGLLRGGMGGAPPRLTPGAVAALAHSWAFSSEKARSELGYSVTPVRTALQETLAWLQDSGR